MKNSQLRFLFDPEYIRVWFILECDGFVQVNAIYVCLCCQCEELTLYIYQQLKCWQVLSKIEITVRYTLESFSNSVKGPKTQTDCLHTSFTYLYTSAGYDWIRNSWCSNYSRNEGLILKRGSVSEPNFKRYLIKEKSLRKRSEFKLVRNIYILQLHNEVKYKYTSLRKAFYWS